MVWEGFVFPRYLWWRARGFAAAARHQNKFPEGLWPAKHPA